MFGYLAGVIVGAVAGQIAARPEAKEQAAKAIKWVKSKVEKKQKQDRATCPCGCH